MHPALGKLVELDRIETTCDSVPLSETEKGVKSKARSLRAEVSADVLTHYDRLKARGKKAVAPVVNGTCQACYLRLSSSAAARLRDKSQIHLCENCGTYIYPIHAPPPSSVSPQTRRKRVSSRRDSFVPGDAPLQVA